MWKSDLMSHYLALAISALFSAYVIYSPFSCFACFIFLEAAKCVHKVDCYCAPVACCVVNVLTRKCCCLCPFADIMLLVLHNCSLSAFFAGNITHNFCIVWVFFFHWLLHPVSTCCFLSSIYADFWLSVFLL